MAYIPPIGSMYNLYTTYIVPSGGLYATYHPCLACVEPLAHWNCFSPCTHTHTSEHMLIVKVVLVASLINAHWHVHVIRVIYNVHIIIMYIIQIHLCTFLFIYIYISIYTMHVVGGLFPHLLLNKQHSTPPSRDSSQKKTPAKLFDQSQPLTSTGFQV